MEHNIVHIHINSIDIRILGSSSSIQTGNLGRSNCIIALLHDQLWLGHYELGGQGNLTNFSIYCHFPRKSNVGRSIVSERRNNSRQDHLSNQ